MIFWSYDFLVIVEYAHISRYIPVILKSKMVWNFILIFQNVQTYGFDEAQNFVFNKNK